MNSEKNFYDILRSKFNNSELPFDEENWKTMRKMIDESRAAKNRAVWLITSLGLLLCAGGVFAIYTWNAGSGRLKNISAQYSSVPKPPTPSTINATPVSNSILAPETSASIATMGNSQTGALNSEPVAIDKTPVNRSARLATANNSQHEKSAEGRKHNTQSGNQNRIANNVASSSETQNTTAQETGSGNKLTGEEKPSNTLTNQGGISPLPAPIETKETSSVVKAANKITDSAVVNETMPPRFSDEPFILQGKKNIFSIELGTEYSGGWDYGSTTQGHGFNPIAGVGYMRYIKSKWFVKTGLQFLDFGNMSSVPYTIQHQSGNVVNDSIITTKRLYYITIPIQLEYYLGKNTLGGNKNTVGLGGSVSYLLGSSGSVTTYQQFDNNPPVNILQYSQSATPKGYTAWNTSVYGFYKRTFSHKLSLYAIIYSGLTDIKNNSFFGTALFERDKGLKILLSYNL